MVFLLFILFIIVVAWFIYTLMQCKPSVSDSSGKPTENNNAPTRQQEDKPISATSQSKVKVVVGGGKSDAPVQKLKYFCIKDKGYHTSVWPKDYDQFDIVEFNIAGMSHRDNIDDYIGEFVGTLEPEPTNNYDQNAIKILAPDGHHVGYVPKDMTSEIRDNATLPCQCFCYIGENDGAYFSDCYILRPNVSQQ